MNRRLHEITADMLALEELLLESGGEWTPEVEALVAEMDGNLEAKAQGYASLIREWELDAEKWKAEAKRCAGHQKARENAADRLKERLRGELERMKRLEVEAGPFKIAVQNNPPKLRVLARPDDLPEQLRIVVPAHTVPELVEVNNAEVLAMLKGAIPPKPKKAADALTPDRERELRDQVLLRRGDAIGVFPRVEVQDGDTILAELDLTTHLRIR